MPCGFTSIGSDYRKWNEPWADKLAICDLICDMLLIKHVEGPLFFGFASQLLDIARQARDQSRGCGSADRPYLLHGPETSLGIE
jgi:hypothetical protein